MTRIPKMARIWRFDMANKRQVICISECPACGEFIEFTTLGIQICPYCAGTEAELTINWTIIEDKDNGETQTAQDLRGS